MWITIACQYGPGLSAGVGIPGLNDVPGKPIFFPDFPAFQDLTIYKIRFELYHSPYFYVPSVEMPYSPIVAEGFAYPPAAAVVYSLFFLAQTPEVVYLRIFAIWLLLASIAGWVLLTRCGQTVFDRILTVLAIVLFSFPVLFLAQRANLELFTWFGLSLALLLYRKKQFHAAAAIIGVAAAIKLYPILFFGLFLKSRRQSYAVLTGLLAAFLTTVFSIWYAGPTFLEAAHGFFNGVAAFKSQHAETARIVEAPLDHSLLSLIKVFYLSGGSIKPWIPVYYVAAAVTTLTLFFTRIRTFPFLNRLAFCTVAMLLLPPVSYEYTLVHLYAVLVLILAAVFGRNPHLTLDRIPRSLTLCTAAILIALLPTFLLEEGKFVWDGLIQLGALLAVWVTAAWSPWPTTIDQTVST
jgi:hypothetical protein